MKKVLFLAVFGTGIASMVFATNVKSVMGESKAYTKIPYGRVSNPSKRYNVIATSENVVLADDSEFPDDTKVTTTE